MNASISILASTARCLRVIESRKRKPHVRLTSQRVDDVPTPSTLPPSTPSSPSTPSTPTYFYSHVAAYGMRILRQRLEAPTHEKCAARNAPSASSLTAAYRIDAATSQLVDHYCHTCMAFDVSGAHRAFGHRVA